MSFYREDIKHVFGDGTTKQRVNTILPVRWNRYNRYTICAFDICFLLEFLMRMMTFWNEVEFGDFSKSEEIQTRYRAEPDWPTNSSGSCKVNFDDIITANKSDKFPRPPGTPVSISTVFYFIEQCFKYLVHYDDPIPTVVSKIYGKSAQLSDLPPSTIVKYWWDYFSETGSDPVETSGGDGSNQQRDEFFEGGTVSSLIINRPPPFYDMIHKATIDSGQSLQLDDISAAFNSLKDFKYYAYESFRFPFCYSENFEVVEVHTGKDTGETKEELFEAIGGSFSHWCEFRYTSDHWFEKDRTSDRTEASGYGRPCHTYLKFKTNHLESASTLKIYLSFELDYSSTLTTYDDKGHPHSTLRSHNRFYIKDLSNLTCSGGPCVFYIDDGSGPYFVVQYPNELNWIKSLVSEIGLPWYDIGSKPSTEGSCSMSVLISHTYLTFVHVRDDNKFSYSELPIPHPT